MTTKLWWKYLKCWWSGRHYHRWLSGGYDICQACGCVSFYWSESLRREKSGLRRYTPWYMIPFTKKLKLYEV